VLRSLDGIERLLPLLLRARLGGGPEVEVMLGLGEITSLLLQLLLIGEGIPVGCCSPIRSCTCMVFVSLFPSNGWGIGVYVV
jgi:hypothetical protein